MSTSSEQKRPERVEKSGEAHKPADKLAGEHEINTTQANADHHRLKVQDAIKSFKLTGPGQESFRISMGDGHEAKDPRPARVDLKSHDVDSSVVTVGSQATEKVVHLAKAVDADATITAANNQEVQEPRPVDHDYAHRSVKTCAPRDVVVIGAEGEPGKLYELNNGNRTELSLKQLGKEIEKMQAAKSEGADKPKLVYLEACHTGENGPDGASTASKIAKDTHSWVVGNLGFGDSQRPDTTMPQAFDVAIPFTNLHLHPPNPFALDKVALFDPSGKKVAEFDTPVDWKKVKQTMNNLQHQAQAKHDHPLGGN